MIPGFFLMKKRMYEWAIAIDISMTIICISLKITIKIIIAILCCALPYIHKT